MAITINIYYTGENGSAREFANEMTASGIVENIKSEKGNLKYDYFLPFDGSDTVLLIDSWENQESLDRHHSSLMMKQIIMLREKYNLSMRVERYLSDDESITDNDKNFIRRK